MSKFYGAIGYGITTEKVPGVWEDTYVEKMYFGDLNRITKKSEAGTSLNNNISIDSELSVVADPYAQMNFQYIKYAVVNGVKWEARSVAIDYHRLIITLGGVYNV